MYFTVAFLVRGALMTFSLKLQ